MTLLTISLLMLLAWSNAQSEYPTWINGTFPDDFAWGFATASYQVEGAWATDGKGENIWDNFTHRIPTTIFDSSSGDVACDSYNRYQVDIQLMKSMGADFYRFSISWSRVIPTGRVADGINQLGIDYYNYLINELIANNIEPMITMYHWDLPQGLQDLYGGWLNPTIVDDFESYADLLYRTFGDRVKKWITINEPWVVCVMGYGDAVNAPGVREPATGPYQCGHNIIKAHARAYRLYERTYKATQQGSIGITIDSGWCEPRDRNNPSHVETAERCQQFRHGWFAYPIFEGSADYPPLMKQYVQRKSEEDNLLVSRLPVFTPEEKLMINGSADFLGFNHYTADLVVPGESTDRSWYGDQDVSSAKDPSWPTSASTWLVHVPWGFRRLLVWIKDTYHNPLVYVTENGWSDTDVVGLNDDGRIRYYREYINEMMKAVLIDECNVRAYTAWSLMDNFEWARGYTERFGIHWVDFNHPHRPRYAKKSAAEVAKIFRDNGFPNSSTTIVVSIITYALAFVVVLYGSLY